MCFTAAKSASTSCSVALLAESLPCIIMVIVIVIVIIVLVILVMVMIVVLIIVVMIEMHASQG